MLKISDVKILISCKSELEDIIAKKLSADRNEIVSYSIIKKSLDARKKGSIFWVYSFAVEVKNEEAILKKNLKNVSALSQKKYSFNYKRAAADERPVITGMGQAGLFCALMLSRCGLNPIVIERGESVNEREKSIQRFWQDGTLNTNSNVQFGEGGAGTFSDGKLTCGVNDIRKQFVLDEFAAMGAPEEIRYLSKPHIGTDYLKKVVANIRSEIISNGGEVVFDTMLTDIEICVGKIKKIFLKNVKNGRELERKCGCLILAIGHSARETYSMLYKKGIAMQKKPFSVGVRIEHKREYIDMLQYKEAAPSLPAADYKLSCHPDGRGAYTFCMCPGGVVVASASESGGVVTNGMSYFARDAENSNSALLVSVLPEDIDGENPLDAVEFQRRMERAAFACGGSNYFAPCQKVSDFIDGTASDSCGTVEPSYKPGVRYADLSECLPDFVCRTLRNALLEFDRKMPGFCIGDAVLTGVETRSSAPVRINRGENMVSSVDGIYPIGEGAGYAGGIMSSAIDGIKCAEKIIELLSF